MKDLIRIRNARQHNLKGFDLDLPRRALVVFTGPSGSGKSSLAFDTLYAEGQRRYVESLSSYAKQFLERLDKPNVDLIEGLSPAVAIEQKNPTKTSRSTVGTATESYDYLRLLWARAGRTFCPECGRRVLPDTVQSATDVLESWPVGTRALIAFPLPRSARITHERVVENLRALGFVRVLVAGATLDLTDPAVETAAGAGHDLASADELLVVVDRVTVRPEERARIADSLGTAFAEGEGEVIVVRAGAGESGHAASGRLRSDAESQLRRAGAGESGHAASGRLRSDAESQLRRADGERVRFSDKFRCPEHPEATFAEPTPRLFSFNNPYGSCPTCTGFGAVLEYDLRLIVPNEARSLREGAVDPWEKPRYHRYRSRLLAFAKAEGVNIEAPWESLPAAFRKLVIRGRRGVFQGVIPFLRSREEKRYKQYIRVFLRQYQSALECSDCHGTKLRAEALRVRVGGLDIAAAANLPIARLREWVGQFAAGLTEDPPTAQEQGIASPILRELSARLAFLDDVGLGYLTMHRQTRTLSGGEAQRIALANSLGSSLTDTLYVLDEPTIGLHPRDTDRLLRLLEQLRERGNSVVVVEHDAAAIARADHVVELGPGSGEKGGAITFQGTFDQLLHADTATGRFVSGREPLPPLPRPRGFDPRRIRLTGARLHNLKGVDIDIPVGALTVVTGVSGSGKSTLVHDVLYRALERELADGETSAKLHLGEVVGDYDRLDGVAYIDAAVLVDQQPIGKSHRSNPITYIKAFDSIREVFAQQPLAQQRGYGAGHFSFNVKGGRCEACEGEGVKQIEMVFLADVYITCDVCGGARYKRDVLEVKFKGRNIREVLDLTVDEAIRFFIREDRLGQMLWQLQQVGLGYLRLGQPAPTLSGGEAQRLKIARELITAGKKRGHRLYLLDEPTTGLSGPEVRKLLGVLRRLVDLGHTVVLIEHNVETMVAADWIIDLGPEAGDAGGEVVAAGTPAEVAEAEGSYTAHYLREALAARANNHNNSRLTAEDAEERR